MAKTKRLVYQVYGTSRGPEEALVKSHAETLGLELQSAGIKQMERNRIPLSIDDLVVGSIPFVKAAARQLKILLPKEEPYPEMLRPWFYRKVRQVPELRQVLESLDNGGPSVFVKPAESAKRFTGFVLENPSDYRIAGVSRRTPVWISNPVQFVSEWRCYVVEGIVRDMQFADHGGDKSRTPDRESVKQACRALVDAGLAPNGFVIDFGVLSTGETALVEVNDGYSCGAYGNLSAAILFDLYEARWQELISKRQ